MRKAQAENVKNAPSNDKGNHQQMAMRGVARPAGEIEIYKFLINF